MMNKRGRDRSQSWPACRLAPDVRVLRVKKAKVRFRIESKCAEFRTMFLPNTDLASQLHHSVPSYRARYCISE
jgi:hypothetical protein